MISKLVMASRLLFVLKQVRQIRTLTSVVIWSTTFSAARLFLGLKNLNIANAHGRKYLNLGPSFPPEVSHACWQAFSVSKACGSLRAGPVDPTEYSHRQQDLQLAAVGFLVESWQELEGGFGFGLQTSLMRSRIPSAALFSQSRQLGVA